MTTKQIHKGTITTSCTCAIYNEETGDWEESPECWDCWSDDVRYFSESVTPLFTEEEEHLVHGEWQVGYKFSIQGIGLWNRTVGGTFVVADQEELLRAMTVNGDYTLRWQFDETTNELSALLSHHDCPTGSTVTVKAVK